MIKNEDTIIINIRREDGVLAGQIVEADDGWQVYSAIAQDMELVATFPSLDDAVRSIRKFASLDLSVKCKHDMPRDSERYDGVTAEDVGILALLNRII